MAKVTEEDVVKYYYPFVIQECKNSYKGLEPDDRVTEGVLALIHAIRTYKTQYGCFEDYLLLQLRLIMKQKNKEAWAIKKLESILSLDSPVLSHKESFTLLDFIKSAPHDDTVIDVGCFIDGLSITERKVVVLLINGYSLSALSNELKLSQPEVQNLVKNLQSKAKIYWDIGH